MSAREDLSRVAEPVQTSETKEVREALVDALLKESREELERIDLKASILMSVFGLALVGIVHAAAYLHWDPRTLGGAQWFLWAGMGLGCIAIVVLAVAVWPRLANTTGEQQLTYFGHVAQHDKVEELNAALDREASTHSSPTDHAVKRLLALSKIIHTKYRWIRWGMGLFGAAVPLCVLAIVFALTQ